MLILTNYLFLHQSLWDIDINLHFVWWLPSIIPCMIEIIIFKFKNCSIEAHLDAIWYVVWFLPSSHVTNDIPDIISCVKHRKTWFDKSIIVFCISKVITKGLMGKEALRQWREYNYPEWATGYLCPSFCLKGSWHLFNI